MKDYKKILEGVVDIINTTEKSDIGFANICAYIGENCPELKESEDEKMIQYFKDLAPFDKADELYEKYGFSHKDAIAWLEKQGEHANFCDKIQIGDKVTRNQDGVLVNLSQLKRVAKKDEKQGGLKPYGQREECIDCQMNYAGECKGSCAMKRGEQKPVDFSDLRTWKYIIDTVLTEKEGIGQYLDSPFTEEVAKKLQKRFGNIEQKPAWSEEDEKMLDTLIANYKFLSKEFRDKEHNFFVGMSLVKEDLDMINWLKSLRLQSTWKPSDEQMEALDIAIRCGIQLGTWEETSLKDLREQLKKL